VIAGTRADPFSAIYFLSLLILEAYFALTPDIFALLSHKKFCDFTTTWAVPEEFKPPSERKSSTVPAIRCWCVLYECKELKCLILN
jgi:hypothetical protein